VSQSIRSESKDAYAYYLQKVPNLGETGFYNELPKILQHKFVSHKFFREIHHLQFFRSTEIALIARLIIYYKPQLAVAGEIIYDGGDFADEMSFLTKGSVRLLMREGAMEVMMGVASSGHYFGDFEYYKRTTRICCYKAYQNCTLFSIGYNRFDEALVGNHKAQVKIKKMLKR
jgi:CRP-like cAMP-binding protein